MNMMISFCRWQGELMKCSRQISTGNNILWAGHSKWANIRHIKAAKDGERAAMFQRFSRRMMLAIQDGGSSNPALNSQLRAIIQEALKLNMPMSSIQNTLKRNQETPAMKVKRYRIDFRYKQKVFMIVVARTENFSHLKQSLTSIAKKSEALLIDTCSIFDEYGFIQAIIDSNRLSGVGKNKLEEIATEDAIECGAEEIEVENIDSGCVNFICSSTDLMTVRKELQKKCYSIERSDLIYVPTNMVHLDSEELKGYERFLTKLHEIPAIDEIYDNIANKLAEE